MKDCIGAVGVSINRWEPANALRTLRTGLIDAVQVIYNIFDQAPEDELFPLCRELDIGVIARVPFDEGSLTGTLTKTTRWPDGDWRNGYFVPENLAASVDHADALKPLVPAGQSMTDLALRFILSNADVDVVIPGMRKPAHVRANIAASDAGPLDPRLLDRAPGAPLGPGADVLVAVGLPRGRGARANASRPDFVIKREGQGPRAGDIGARPGTICHKSRRVAPRSCMLRVVVSGALAVSVAVSGAFAQTKTPGGPSATRSSAAPAKVALRRGAHGQ